MQNALFYITGALMVFCALRCVTTPYIFRSALYLAATLSLTAVQYILLQADFVAIVQILVYVGAVIILIVFAVMLTAQLGEGNISQSNRRSLWAALVSFALGYCLYRLLSGYDWSKVKPAAGALEAGKINIQHIGQALVGDYVYPFEIIGLLLFSALIGAVLIARKDPRTMTLINYLVLSAILFGIGLYGLLSRRNAVGVLMATELMLNSVNLNLVAFNKFLHPAALSGQMFTLFTITVAAAEATVGLALVVSMFRSRRTVMLEDINTMKW